MASNTTQVLLVEDNPIDARLMERSLARSTDMRVALTHVTDLAAAIAALRVRSFDAVLLDLMLPDSLGVETIHAIHQVDRNIPVVVLTGMEDTELALAAVRHGAQDYLVKEGCDTDRVMRSVRYSIERVRHAADQRALNEARHQLHLASVVQRARFPRRAPDLPGYDIAGACVPATATGGDYFDFIPMSGSNWGVAIGDASGHGLGSAMVMSDVRAILRTLTTVADDAGEIVRRLNRIAVRDLGVSMFMTLMFVRLDPMSGRLEYAGAGHAGALLDVEGNVRMRLVSEAPPLNVVEDLPMVRSGDAALAPGESLLLYTDGINESRTPANELFGERRVLEFLRDRPDSPASDLVEGLITAARRFSAPAEGEDDMTVVIVRRLPATSESGLSNPL